VRGCERIKLLIGPTPKLKRGVLEKECKQGGERITGREFRKVRAKSVRAYGVRAFVRRSLRDGKKKANTTSTTVFLKGKVIVTDEEAIYRAPILPMGTSLGIRTKGRGFCDAPGGVGGGGVWY